MTKSLLILCMVISLESFFISSLIINQSDEELQDFEKLKVGIELKKQILPLNSGQKTYVVHDIIKHRWYEIKISYPASIPASFSIQVNNDINSLRVSKNRRLLDTEKVIFKSTSSEFMYAIVTVKSNGIVAKRNVEDGPVVYFNIVCDELALGIPYRAWPVGIAAVFLLVFAAVAPCIFNIKQLLMVRASAFSFESDPKTF